MTDLTHFDDSGASRMVDVGDKPVTHRMARAEAVVRMMAPTRERIETGLVAKGNVVEVARLAGIMAVKRTGDLIPLCHPLAVDSVNLDFDFPDDTSGDPGSALIRIRSTVEVRAKTGVEMEALVAVSTAALTIYDMCKAIDRGMQIECIQLLEKKGGKSGHFTR